MEVKSNLDEPKNEKEPAKATAPEKKDNADEFQIVKVVEQCSSFYTIISPTISTSVVPFPNSRCISFPSWESTPPPPYLCCEVVDIYNLCVHLNMVE